jgi:hypothetical protein
VTITIDIAPEVQAELARQAAEHGAEIDAYVLAGLGPFAGKVNGVIEEARGTFL